MKTNSAARLFSACVVVAIILLICGNLPAFAQRNYLMKDMTNYAGTTFSGDGILPNYGQGATDNDGGFNGIVMRWIDTANAHGFRSSTVLARAEANVDQAWSIRDGQELMWDDWAAQTPATSGAVYSWDCSSAVVGMFDIPVD